MKKRDRNKEIRLQIEEYREKLRKMNKAQFAEEWNRVMLWLNPEYEEAVKDMVRESKPTTYERTRDAVYATGNKWARENFDSTHN